MSILPPLDLERPRLVSVEFKFTDASPVSISRFIDQVAVVDVRVRSHGICDRVDIAEVPVDCPGAHDIRESLGDSSLLDRFRFWPTYEQIDCDFCLVVDHL